MIGAITKSDTCPALLRFIGDMFCDRGQCDYWTLLLYQQFDREGIAFKEMFSNHTMNLLMELKVGRNELFDSGCRNSQANSLIAMNELIGRGLISPEEVSNTLQPIVLKHTVLVDSVLSSNCDNAEQTYTFFHMRRFLLLLLKR